MQLAQLYLVCIWSGLYGVVTPTEDDGNFVCVMGSKSYTNCQVLKFIYGQWIQATERYISNKNAFAVLVNVTSDLTHQLDVMRGRQAVTATFQAIQFSIMVVAYLVTVMIMAIVKMCKKKEAELLETQLEELETRLAERKRTARRKAARPSPQEQ